MKISQVDPNFKSCEAEGVSYQLCDPAALGLEGFAWEAENEKPYCRLPERILPGLNEGVQYLSTHAAGGVVRFRTDSSALLLKGHFRPVSLMSHMPLTGQAGFDVMRREGGAERLVANLRPEPASISAGSFDFSLSCPLPEGMHEYRIYLPLYAGLEELQIGLCVDARVEKAPVHKVEKPILFYGSSITQGGCASRPSNCHAALLSAWVDAEQINLGFSGNAKGQPPIAEAIAELNLSCFVMDYDHNAPDAEHLQRTHEPFFKIIRQKHPELPVIFISRVMSMCEERIMDAARRDVILKTYLKARNEGDENVYFVDGGQLFDEISPEYPTVDRCHPTDLGFYLMAKGILPALRAALGLV